MSNDLLEKFVPEPKRAAHLRELSKAYLEAVYCRATINVYFLLLYPIPKPWKESSLVTRAR
jgi:hypothetical protein